MAQRRAAEKGRGRVEWGFTLVEIMLAVALLSIIVTVMYSAFHTMGRIVRRTERTKGAYQAARLIMSRMRQDLACAYFSPVRDNFVFRGEDIAGADGDADALSFVTTGHVISGRDMPEGDLAEVSYYIDEENPGILVRREDVSPDDELESGGVLDILGENVVSLNFAYYSPMQERRRRARESTTDQDETQEDEDTWKDEWDPDETPYLPRAVKIDLSLLNEEGEVEDFSSTVVLAMGRTATSIQPSLQQGAGRPGAPVPPPPTLGTATGIRPTTQPVLPQQGFPRMMPRREGEGRGDRAPEGDRRRRWREGGEGLRQPGSGTAPPRDVLRIQRSTPDGTPGTYPPTPGGRR